MKGTEDWKEEAASSSPQRQGLPEPRRQFVYEESQAGVLGWRVMLVDPVAPWMRAAVLEMLLD